MKKTGAEFLSFTFNIAKLFRLVSNLVQEVFSDNGFKFTNEQLWVLLLLWEKQGVNQQYIGNKLMRDKATISHLVNVLESKKIVYRVSDPRDERQKLIHLTDAGEEMKVQVSPSLWSALGEVPSLLPKGDHKDFGRILELLVLNFS